jgi:hypothetical protein
MKSCILLFLLLCFSSCSLFRSETNSNSAKDINTVTKKTVVTDTIAPDGRVIPLKQTTYEEVTSKEVARAEQKTDYNSDFAGAIGGAASGLFGMGGIAEVIGGAIGLGGTTVAVKKGVSMYNTIRDAPPRQPVNQAQPVRATKREDDEPPVTS